MKPPAAASGALISLGICIAVQLLAPGVVCGAQSAGRETLNFNQGWRFYRIEAPPPADVQLPPAAMIAQGEFSAGHEAKTVTFRQALARYVALESTSSQRPDDPHAAIAELDLLDAAGQTPGREIWRIAYASSAQPGNPPEAILDGDPGTFWHSRYSPTPFPHHPHFVVIDLGEIRQLTGFRYLPRAQDLPGLIKGYRFYASAAPFPGLSQAENVDGSPVDFNDTDWEIVNLPHTVRLEPWNASGGENFRGLCWYRKHFTLDDRWKGKRMLLDFGGAMQVAEVWLNGKKITTHYGGYLPFVLDISALARFGSDNVIALRLDNRDQPLVPPGKPQNSLDFTYFGGLYRDVRLTVTELLHVTDPLLSTTPAGGGVFVTFPQVGADKATVRVKTEVANGFDAVRNCQLRQDLIDAEGKTVASASNAESIAGSADHTFTQLLTVTQPSLWHPDHPYLYSLRTSVYDGESLADEVVTRIGIRTFEFRTDGLFINGQRFYSIGFNHHQDYPYIGYAVPDSLQYRDVRKMREANMTSFRSHYPHARSFMDACDELGVLTIVSTPGWQYFNTNPVFLNRSYQATREMVRLNRNRPSVILWEIGLNETGYSKEFAEQGQKIVHEEFPDGPCYTSGDGSLDWQKADPVFDVLYKAPFNQSRRPEWWREFGDFYDMNWDDQVSGNRVARGYGEYAMLLQARNHQEALVSMLDPARHDDGADLWAGIDCDRGYHPTPFLGGILDKARLPKFDYYLFASQRPADLHVDSLDDGPMVFIANLMTRFSPKDVTVFSNCEEVRLLFTPREKPEEIVGTQKIVKKRTLPHAPAIFKSALPDLLDGCRLKAQGLIGGKVVAEQSIGTAGVPVKLALTLDRCGRDLIADGSDIMPIHAMLEDRNGNVVTLGDETVLFSTSGPADVVGDASIEANPTRTELGIATALIRSRPQPGKITVTATVRGLSPAELEFESLALTDPVVLGRDVGQMSMEHSTAQPTAPVAGPAVMPGADVIKAQTQSQNLRKESPQQ